MKVYCISGLGADERMFQRLNFPEFCRVQHLSWLTPEGNETLTAYAKRFANLIDNTKPFVIIGLSFGGIMAIEVAEFARPEKIILISSLTTRKEIPAKFRMIGRLNLHKLIPAFFYSHNTIFTNWLFGTTNSKDKNLLSEILKQTPPSFTRWAVDRILNWKRTNKPENLYHIHGGNDRIIPVKCVHPDVVIKGAGHVMIMTHARQVSVFLDRVLNNQ